MSGNRIAISRRQLLKASALTGLGLTAPTLLRGASAAETSVTFAGWAFEPQVVEANVKVFMQQNPDIKVNYTPLDLQLYNEKMVALFNARNVPDAFYVRDTNLGAWVEAGWLQPIDGLPKLDELNKDIFPFNREALFYRGKQYGRRITATSMSTCTTKGREGGRDHSAGHARSAQGRGSRSEEGRHHAVSDPQGYKTNVDGLSEFWSMVFASGGKLFNEAMDPVFPNEDKTALGVLEWMLDAMHTWQILDPKGLELDETQARDVFLSGQGVFTSNVGNVFPRANNPQHSKRAGDIAMMRFPGLKDDISRGPMGWTRLYGISADTKVRDAAWRLIYYMGGKDASGNYYTAKDWYLKYGVGYAFKSLDNDPDIVEAQRKAGYDRDVLKQQVATARARENIAAPWYNDWDRFTQQQIQNTLLRRIKPQDALVASANKARELKKQG